MTVAAVAPWRHRKFVRLAATVLLLTATGYSYYYTASSVFARRTSAVATAAIPVLTVPEKLQRAPSAHASASNPRHAAPGPPPAVLTVPTVPKKLDRTPSGPPPAVLTVPTVPQNLDRAPTATASSLKAVAPSSKINPSALSRTRVVPAEGRKVERRPYLDLPDEYKSKDDELCQSFFTDDYVYNIANSSETLCDGGSRVHGFAVQTHPHHRKLTGATPVYLLQGVTFNQTERKFHAQCTGPQVKRPVIYGTPIPEVSYGAMLEGNSTLRCDKNTSKRQLIIYPALKEHNDNVWHRLMELWQNKLSYDAMRIAIDPATGNPLLTEEQIKKALVVFPDNRKGPWDAEWKMLTGRTPLRYSQLSPDTCYDVVIGTVGWASPFWSALLSATYETCRRETLLSTFVRWIFKFYGLKERSAADIHRQPTITVIQRAKTRKFRHIDQLVESIRAQHPGFQVNVVDLGTMSKKEQVRLIHASDVLVGHHGAGMSFTMVMRPDSAVVEILPPVFGSRGFRRMSRMRGLVHFIGKAMWKEEYEKKYRGKPVPKGWRPAKQGDGDARGWQNEEWIWIPHEEVLGLVDAAVKSQLNGINDG
ncbi:uncharacterized protein EV422DRAFT_509840 [Fimicolochytrium jonesii]|uniref:uncharacterized protein n=1 Tax=Fimicolochytrium jonesii TaxID=1396493 RepID=UPI0022FF3B42|nr:uncharacterized protein EV422DRAFT_509840 [Fimicolochytrium jonesii]KAI8816430.1 hypothetical protein EV422DRAFT_509840 [Fimicolochytrium jonesii]